MDLFSHYYDLLKSNLTPELLTWLSVASVVMMVATLLLSGVLLLRLPRDFFTQREDLRERFVADKPRWLVYLIVGVKNVIGVVLLLAGILMLILPGQGILTIIASLLLIDFPGKFKLIGKLVENPKVRNGMNALRVKFGKEPFDF
jgi:hypothetical protein